jgi:proteasome lid subunit RPN8/RPN11/cell fate (sporulation/competence/biofilm development) regulator YlbF (YheA/YmcA/DUF963 family)
MAQKINEFPNEKPIVIKPKAYMTMLKHVLTYGNEVIGRSNSVEVMGICYGKEEGGKLVQYEAVPIAHGNLIEVEFTPEDYASFAAADEQFMEQGYYAIGWYHSHPGHKAFFSKVDIQNHLSWQKEQTPHAYGIVFDHQYLDYTNPNNNGFKVFRLDDYKKGINSGYHEVQKVEVELPEDTEYYSEIIKIIERSQTKKPIVEEAKDSYEGSAEWAVEDFEADQADVEEAEKKKATKPFEKVRKGYSEGMQAFSEMMVTPIMDMLEEYFGDIDTAIKKGPKAIIPSLEDLRDNINSGMARVKQNFESSLEKEIEAVNTSNNDDLKEYFTKEDKLFAKIDDLSKNLTAKLENLIADALNEKMQKVVGAIEEVVNIATKLGEQQTKFTTGVKEHGQKLDAFAAMADKDISGLSKNMTGIIGSLKSSVEDNASNIRDSIKEISGVSKNLKDEIDALTKIINSKRK